MRFNRNARLDTSQVQDRRGSGSGGGLGGIRIGKGAAAGGGLGLVGVIAVVLFAVLSGGGSGGDALSGLLGELSGSGATGSADNAQLEQECHTGADAGSNDDCAVVAIVNSVQAFWADELAGSGTRIGTHPRCSIPARRPPAAVRAPRRWGRSIAPRTPRCTSICRSGTT